jgi:L-lactate utilization protein LutC
MAAEVTAAGGQCYLCDDAETARARLTELCGVLRPGLALCWEHWLLERLKVAEILASLGAEYLCYRSIKDLPREAQRERIMSANVGISSCDYAVAETGTLAVFSRSGQERSASLLPPVHIALVAESQILPDLFDLFTRIGKAAGDGLPSNIAFITGPSKTGDIELQLTTGVHGPGEVHVIVVRGV